MSEADTIVPQSKPSSRAWWLKQLYQWHWISSAISLIGLILFAITGFTLNHAGAIPSEPKVTARSAVMPPQVAARLAVVHDDAAPLPPPVRQWLEQEMSVEIPVIPAEWSEEEVYLALPRPGGDTWIRFDRVAGKVEYERTTRGVISLLNDLHKGRNTGDVWFWFIDVFAVACLVFCITGLVLLQLMAEQRKSTWPVVSAGLVIPLLIAVLFIHM